MSQSSYTIDELPELPLEALELGGRLRRAPRAPVLTVDPPKLAPPETPPTPTPLVPKSQFTTRRYLAQATYPRVVCYPFPELPEEIVLEQPAPPRSRTDLVLTARSERHFKLSHFEGTRLERPHFCSVKYGPWAAVAIEQESCTVGVPNSWEFFIVEMPEVHLQWFGFWEDIPAYPSLHVIMGTLTQVDEATACCPGYKLCPATQSCIDISINCNDGGSPV